MSRILVIDDEPAICWSFDRALSAGGHDVTIASTAEAALAEIEQSSPDVIVLDYRLPGMNGLQALEKLKAAAAATPVILMTAFGNLELAVAALGEGAFDYLPKPFDLDEAVEVIARALASRSMGAAAPSGERTDTGEILGVSRGMQEVFRQIALVAPLDVPVLITGESGVGKEMVARAIHRHSGRPQERFVPICVPSLSESLLESELFGHVKGAFTGADRTRPGLLDQADGGTAFFDEIGEIPLPQQVKLLRVLEDRQIVPVGGNESHPSTFRLIAASHQPLEAMTSEGRFREDLYYRLSVFSIHIPALRERSDDILPLARRFLSQASRRPELSLAPETADLLTRYRWIGNVRELRSAMQHAAVVCRGNVVTPECLPGRISGRDSLPVPPLSELHALMRDWAGRQLPSLRPDQVQTTLYERFLQEFEPLILETALNATDGNCKAAAELLGLHRETLRKRLRRHKIRNSESGDELSSQEEDSAT